MGHNTLSRLCKRASTGHDLYNSDRNSTGSATIESRILVAVIDEVVRGLQQADQRTWERHHRLTQVPPRVCCYTGSRPVLCDIPTK